MSRLERVFTKYKNKEAVLRLERVFLACWECRTECQGWEEFLLNSWNIEAGLEGLLLNIRMTRLCCGWKGFLKNYRNVEASCRGWEGFFLIQTM